MANNALSTEFLDKFRSESQALSERILASSGKDKQSEKEAFLSGISKLRKDLIDATPYLPTFDQRTSELQIKSLEKQLDGFIEGSSAGSSNVKTGSKFSFKRAARPNPPTAIPEKATSDSLPPSDEGPGESVNSAIPTTLQVENQESSGLTHKEAFRRVAEEWSVPDGETIPSNDVSLSSLSDRIINLVSGTDGSSTTASIGAFHAKGLRRCVIMLPNIQGSALIQDCEDCVIAIACHQFRIHTSTRIDVYLQVSSTPVIENCTRMRFAPYTLPQSLVDIDKSKRNQFANVQDFSWIRATPSPNWTLLGTADIFKEDMWPLGQDQKDIQVQLQALLPA